MILRRLSPEAVRLVTRELASGEHDRYEPRDYQRFVDDCPHTIELAAFDRAVETALTASRRHDPAMDRLLAPQIHRALPLGRREAALPGVWRFLTTVHRPDLVRYRWENRSWSTMRTRFWSPGTRPDSNVFARLWWIAELSRHRRDYALTDRLLRRPSLATAIFVRGFSWYRPAVEAFVDVFEHASGAVAEAGARQFNNLLSTVLLESLSLDDTRRWLAEICEHIGEPSRKQDAPEANRAADSPRRTSSVRAK